MAPPLTPAQHLDETAQRTVIGALQSKTVESGVNIITQGEEGDLFYILQRGKADVYVKKPSDDAPKKVHSYSDGDTFGELALLHGEPRAATVTATAQCELWGLDRDTFRRIMMTSGMSEQTKRETFLSNVPLLGRPAAPRRAAHPPQRRSPSTSGSGSRRRCRRRSSRPARTSSARARTARSFTSLSRATPSRPSTLRGSNPPFPSPPPVKNMLVTQPPPSPSLAPDVARQLLAGRLRGTAGPA